MTTAPVRFHNGSAFCARCNALMLRDYPHPLRFHEAQDCTRSSVDAATQEQIVEGLRLVGAGRKMDTPGQEPPARNTSEIGVSASSDPSPTASLEGR